MPDDPKRDGGSALRLQESFPPVPTSTWEEAVRRDLKGAEYEKRLVWRTGEGVTSQPFYRRDDLRGLEAQTAAVPGEYPFVRGDREPWQALERPAYPAGAIRADALHDAGATTVQELAWAVAEGVDRLASGTETGRPVDAVARELSFVFAVGSLYFVEIAKLRAARLLWAAAVRAFGPADSSSCAMRLHARTARANKSIYDSYTNLLRATTEAMSAAIGGADTVLVEPYAFDPHLAANVQRILAEEAHLDAVADPAGGAYYIEVLTDALAREAWAAFQEIERGGGYAAARADGRITAALAGARAARERAVATRRRTLVGVNNYPDLQEKTPSSGPVPSETAEGPAPPLRLAAAFEQIRAATARRAVVRGRYPVVLLLTRGDPRMRMARANFCLNFFGCGGFDVLQADALPTGDAPPPDLVVLCSSDPEYLAFATDVCPRVQVPVLVAGQPRDQMDALREAGVQGFVHVQSDAVETLSEWLRRLGWSD